MANYFLTIPVKDSLIDFIKQSPDTIWEFAEGVPPKVQTKTLPPPSFWQRLLGKTQETPPEIPVPIDWPSSPAKLVTEINHRNVDLYHWALNGSSDSVSHSGSLFQTWVTGTQHSAIDLTGHNEHFAFYSSQIPELLILFKNLSRTGVNLCFADWYREQGNTDELEDSDYQVVWDDLMALQKQIAECEANKQGLIWMPA